MKIRVKPNPFVERQTKQSRFSHTSYTLNELCNLCMHRNLKIDKGFRDGVLEIHLPVKRNGESMFFTPLRELNQGDIFIGGFESRVPGEEPRKWIASHGEKSPARYCKAIVYSSALLAETNQNAYSPKDDLYELISINAGLDEEEPINPEALMHNYFGSDGGTDTKMTPEEFLAQLEVSFKYFKSKVQVIPGDQNGNV